MLRRRILGRKSNNCGYEDVHSSCVVRFLDDSEPMTVTFQKDDSGQRLLDQVCLKLDLAERDYFGLRYVDSEKQRHWLDPTRSAYKQLKNIQPAVLCFRVKFYPSEPLKLKEEITRYFLFLQLSRDFCNGRLLCAQSEANRLAAFIVQAELGDYGYISELNGGKESCDYITQMKNLPKQIQKNEEKVAEIHKTLSGLSPAEAEDKFIEAASHLETYGVDPRAVKDQNGTFTYLGVTHLGIVTFQGNKRTHLFLWPQITKLDYDGKYFIIHVSPTEEKEASQLSNAKKPKKVPHSFKCSSPSESKHLWKCAVQQQYFFTLQSSKSAPKVKAGGGLFRRPSKYRFSGHCESEVLEESAGITREQPSFKRSSSNQFLQNFEALGTRSLPSSLHIVDAKQNSCAVTVETQKSRSESGDEDVVPPILEKVIEKIQEEPVQVFDDNYQPLLSPETEEPPSFPQIKEAPTEDDSGVDLNASNHSEISLQSSRGPLTEVEFSELATAELDAQIKELQMELEKCKSSSPSGSSSSSSPRAENLICEKEDPEAPIPAAPAAAAAAANPGIVPVSCNGKTPVEQAEEAPERIPASSSPWISGRRVLLSVLALLFFVLLWTILIFETRLGIPLVSSMRRWPEVRRFRNRYYRPIRTAVRQFLGW